MVPLVVIPLLQYLTSLLSYWDHGWDRVLEGTPVVVVRDGRLDRPGMRRERMNQHDVLAELRLAGIDDLREVKLAVVETDGRVSVIRQDWAEELRKGDVEGEQRKAMQAATSGEEPAPAARTDSPEALGLS
jgi:uncharacterized membrane protein YcaP (DUF421 family)